MSYDQFKQKLFLTVKEVPEYSIKIDSEYWNTIFQYQSESKKTIDLYWNIITFDEVYNTDTIEEDII